MPQTVIASEAKQSLRLLRHCVPRNDTFLWTFTIVGDMLNQLQGQPISTRSLRKWRKAKNVMLNSFQHLIKSMNYETLK
jgi:hypothetical protein